MLQVNNVRAQEAPTVKVRLTSISVPEWSLPLEEFVTPLKPYTPLYIHRVWTIADGGQLTGAAASRNILTLTLQVNFRIYKGDTITITGLLGAIFPKGPIFLIDPNIGEGTFEQKLDSSSS